MQVVKCHQQKEETEVSLRLLIESAHECCVKVLNKPLIQTSYMKGASILPCPVPCEMSNVFDSEPEWSTWALTSVFKGL